MRFGTGNFVRCRRDGEKFTFLIPLHAVRTSSIRRALIAGASDLLLDELK